MSILIGLMIGTLLGLTGAGGSIFAVPLLILLLNLPTTEAMGIALGAVTVSALLGTLRQRKTVLWVPALLLSAGGILAAPMGKWLSLKADETWLLLGFSSIALFIATRMLVFAKRHPKQTEYVRGSTTYDVAPQSSLSCKLSPTGEFQLKPRCLSGLIVGGLIIGFTSGLFGVGGGFLIVPLLLQLSALSMPRAIATSLATITFISAAGFASHVYFDTQSVLNNGYLFLNVFSAAIIGMLISQKLSQYIAGPTLQRIFAILLIVVSIFLVVQKTIL